MPPASPASRGGAASPHDAANLDGAANDAAAAVVVHPAAPWTVLAAVFVGGCAGGLARELVSRAWPTTSNQFPWAVLVINLSGSFLLAALLTVCAARWPSARYLRPLLASGFCGAFTTFSAVTVSTARLLAHEQAGSAAAYLAASLVGGLLCAAAGLALARLITSDGSARTSPSN